MNNIKQFLMENNYIKMDNTLKGFESLPIGAEVCIVDNDFNNKWCGIVTDVRVSNDKTELIYTMFNYSVGSVIEFKLEQSMGVKESDVSLYIFYDVKHLKSVSNFSLYVKPLNDLNYDESKLKWNHNIKGVILSLMGPSGSGKTYLESSLNDYKDGKVFSKMKQVTTRESRGPGDDYVFISNDTYKNIEHLLIGRIPSTSAFKNSYGTLPIIPPLTIGTAVLSEDGLIDLKNINKDLIKNGLPHYVIYPIYIKGDDLFETREGRDKEFIENERKLFYHSIDTLYKNYDKDDSGLIIAKDQIVDHINALIK